MKRFSLLLCLFFLLNLLGCAAEISEKAPASEEKLALPEDATTDIYPDAELVERYAIGPALGEGPDGSVVLIITDYFSLTLPHEWANTCVYTVTDLDGRTYCVDIYEDEAYWTFGGGKLCTLMLLPTDDPSYKDFPDYQLLAALDTPEGSFHVVALFPTDVQFTEETADTYSTMYEQLMDVLWSIDPVKGVEMAMP